MSLNYKEFGIASVVTVAYLLVVFGSLFAQ
jgi:hypothetical protein